MTADSRRFFDRVDDTPFGLAAIIVVAAVGGIVVGLVAGSFRWCLLHAEDLRASLVHRAQDVPGPGWLITMAGVAVCAAVARLIVRRVPTAAGSGIQDVEAVWRGDADQPGLEVLPAKFVGGLLAIGSGLALGREGPTVHIGSVVGAETGRRLRLPPRDVRMIQAAFGGAGLAVAFNAPLGGSLFVLEEVTKSLRPRLTLVTFVSCATATATSRLILSGRADFAVPHISRPPGWELLIFALFGLLTGLLGALYNRTILGALGLSDRLNQVPPEVRALIIGAFVGLLLFVDPLSMGDGDPLTQRALGLGIAILPALGYGVVRFVIGPISYAAGTPGGLFSPLLAVGAMWGLMFQAGVSEVLPSAAAKPTFAIVGMAAFFAATVRAPFTATVLVVEMTATTTLIGPMLIACVGAVITARIMGSTPIYDSLWERVLTGRGHERSGPAATSEDLDPGPPSSEDPDFEPPSPESPSPEPG